MILTIDEILSTSDAQCAMVMIFCKRGFEKTSAISLEDALAEFSETINPRPIRKRKLMIDDEAFDAYTFYECGERCFHAWVMEPGSGFSPSSLSRQGT